MNIWLMQTGEPLPIRNGIRKMRTAVLADKLLERGHKILWWASAFEHQQKKCYQRRIKALIFRTGIPLEFLVVADIVKIFL